VAFVDLLLNLVGLVLLLAWRTAGKPAQIRGAGTLLSNLKPAGSRPTKRWGYLVTLAGLLLARPLLYSTIAAGLNWTPMIGLGSAALAFRADDPGRLLLHSLLSFGWAWIAALAWATVVVALTSLEREPESGSKVLREMLGWLGRCPIWLQLLFPLFTAAAGWALLTLPLASLGILPRVPPGPELLAQSAVIGASVWLSLKWLLTGILLLRLINTYIYFGSHPLWDFIHRIGGLLIRPLVWLPVRFGKLDFTPLVAAALVWVVWWGFELGLARLFARLNL
jgi:hypothetical protein